MLQELGYNCPLWDLREHHRAFEVQGDSVRAHELDSLSPFDFFNMVVSLLKLLLQLTLGDRLWRIFFLIFRVGVLRDSRGLS